MGGTGSVAGQRGPPSAAAWRGASTRPEERAAPGGERGGGGAGAGGGPRGRRAGRGPGPRVGRGACSGRRRRKGAVAAAGQRGAGPRPHEGSSPAARDWGTLFSLFSNGRPGAGSPNLLPQPRSASGCFVFGLEPPVCSPRGPAPTPPRPSGDSVPAPAPPRPGPRCASAASPSAGRPAPRSRENAWVPPCCPSTQPHDVWRVAPAGRGGSVRGG